MAEQKSEYRGILEKLEALRTRLALLDSIRGAVRAAGLCLIIFGILIVITLIFWPGSTVRAIIDLVMAGLIIAAGYFGVFQPFVNRRGLLPIARMLESHYGKFQSRLIAALELYDKAVENRENYSLELIEKTIDEAGGIIADIDAEAIIDKKPLKATSLKVGIMALAAALGILINPTAVKQSWLLFAHPGADFTRPPDFSLALQPSDSEFYRNSDLTVMAVPLGKTPRKVDLYFKFENGDWAYEPMELSGEDSSSVFEFTFGKIKRSVEIYARSGDIISSTSHIEIVDPPRLVNLNLRIDSPDYSGLPDIEGGPNEGNVSALKGSTVNLSGKTNKPSMEARLLFDDSTEVRLNSEDQTVSGKFRVTRGGRYTVMLKDQAGRTNPEPIWYDVQIIDDYPPSVEIIFPGIDVDLNEQMILPLEMAISDDYGFGRMNLVWQLVSEGRTSEETKKSIAMADKSNREQQIGIRWEINEIGPLPGDMINYYVEVSDNDNISGPKWTKSRTFTARLPNLDEILAEVQGAQEDQIQTLEEALKDQKELQEKVNEMARELLKATEVKWETQQEAKSVMEKQKDIAEKMEQLASEMQENLDRLEENSLIGEEIAEKMQELQMLMEEIAPPEFKEAMRKLQEALQNMDPDEMKKAMENFQMSAEEFLENLDRSLSLLKKLALEQKMDLLTKLAQKILDDQLEINENVENAADSNSLSDLSQSQQMNQNQFGSLQQQFQEFLRMDQDTGAMADEDKAEIGSQLNNPEIPSDFSDMNSSMCKGSKSECKKKGKRLEENLTNLAQAMKNAQQKMQEQTKSDLVEKLRKAAEDLLYLSDRQENLINEVKGGEKTGETLRSLAASQAYIESASGRIANLISEVSKETVFINPVLFSLMGRVLEDLSSATGGLDDRQAQKALISGTSAMASMNMAVWYLIQAQKDVSSSCSGSGMSEMMEKMGQMSQSQSGINQQTMMQMPQPGMPMSQGQQQSLAQLAAQQDALRRQLQEMNDQMGNRGNMLGRLEELGEEMKKVAEDLSSRKVDRKTIERQEKILSRLLDAQKSVHRREFTTKRKSEQGVDIVRRGPALPDGFSTDDDPLFGIIKNALEEKYPRKYEQLIKMYFKSLQTGGSQIEP